MKKLLVACALLLLCADLASAAGKPRYVLEGEIKVRFYYDQDFYNNGFFNYSSLQTDLMNALNYTGTYGLGLKFVQDTSSFNFLVNMGTQKVWSRDQSKAWMDKNLPLQTGIVKVLIHRRGMTPDGVCYEEIPGSNLSSNDMGLTWRALPTGGKATSHLMVTARTSCAATAGLRTQFDLKTTFVHEMGHALAHPGADSRMSQCNTINPASIMCHSVKSGLVRNWQRWFSPDVTLIRTEVFDTSSRQYPLVSCYEYSSYAACDNECINTAGFPAQGATEIYNACVATYCKKMCK